jgi:hypothetical protein
VRDTAIDLEKTEVPISLYEERDRLFIFITQLNLSQNSHFIYRNYG